MNKKENPYVIRARRQYGDDQRWKVGRQLADNKPHVRSARDGSSENDDYVIKGPQYPANKKNLRRFRDEITGMKRLTELHVPGILPVIDSRSTESEAWYVMPKAEPLADHLQERDFDDVVRAFVILADTLSRLVKPPISVSHRDIKPDNLFWYGDSPVLADFGIAAWTDSIGNVTMEGDKLGPMFFLAPEARYYRDGIDWPRADVYSLAMTFWSIAAPRRVSTLGKSTVEVPPPGPISQSHEQFSMYRFGQSDAAALDVLMEQATHFYPTNRPTAAEFRDELSAWLDMYPGSHTPPKFIVTGPHAFKGLQRILLRVEMNEREFLDVLQKECRAVVGTVEWDETVSVNYQPRGELDSDGMPRCSAIMDSHGRGGGNDDNRDDDDWNDAGDDWNDVRGDHNERDGNDDEWDGALVLALREPLDLQRIVIGGILDTDGRADLIVEYHERVDGKWNLRFTNDVPFQLLGRLTTRKQIRDYITDALKFSTTFSGVNSEALHWTGERIL